jgi:hypothetical protein
MALGRKLSNLVASILMDERRGNIQPDTRECNTRLSGAKAESSNLLQSFAAAE